MNINIKEKIFGNSEKKKQVHVPKILIIEEKNNIAKDIRNNLKKLGYEVTAILNSPDDAIREIFKNKPDLIMMDAGSDITSNNLDIALKIKKDFAIPIIYLTSFPEKYILKKANITEPFEYLLKPVNTKNLYSAVEISLYKDEIDKKLKESEGIYRTIFETTGNATIFIESDTTISLANREFEKLSGYSREEIEENKSWTEFVTREDLERMLEYHRMRRIDPTSAPRNYEFRFRDRYGEIKEIYMTTDMIPGTNKSVASFMNISEQKRLESEIIRISEQERQRIGNDLHDGLGPHLVGIKFMINLLKQKLEEKEVDEASKLQEINELITQAINHTRQLVKGLSPVDIDADGLVFALDDLSHNVEKVYGIKCAFNNTSSINIEDNIVAVHLFLIAQEAVNNSIKHSKTKEISIDLNGSGNVITLSVRDDGIGIEKLLDKRKGMGINIMKYRARIINSSLNIGQNDTGGTSVTCTLRLD
jgi:PAS domain S-box-containing protein